MHSPHATRLARAVVGYLAMMIAIITLTPFRFAPYPVNGLTAIFGLRDLVLNVVLFLPLGFVHQLARPRGTGAHWRGALLLGLGSSGIIEVAQVFEPGRFPSLFDLATNTGGAVLGAGIGALVTARTRSDRAVRALAIDLPLVGLVYLLVPLLWLAGLSATPLRAPLVLLPVVSAAWIMATVHREYAAEGTTPRTLTFLPGALLFLVVGLWPVREVEGALLWQGALLFGAVAAMRWVAPAALTHERLPDGGRSRRFESPTLHVALVPLVAFLVLHVIWPIRAHTPEWQGGIPLLPAGTNPTDRLIFRMMAQLSAFTALGYAIAERMGRTHEMLRTLLPRLLLVALPLAAVLELLRGWRPSGAASALLAAMSVLATVLGAWFFLLQLRNVRALLGRDDRRR